MQTEIKTFQTLPEIIITLRKINAEGLTFAEFTELRDLFRNSKKEITAILSTLTKSELSKYVFVRSDDKKAEIIESFYDSLVSSFLLGKGVQYSPFSGETYEGAKEKIFAGQMEDDFLTWKEERATKRAALNKALTNPETLAEFHTFVNKKGEGALSAEQKITFDELRADRSKENKQEDQNRRAQIAAVTVGDVEMILRESQHTIKKIPLWVVQLSERVERDTYTELNNRAHKLGGYYSSYAKGGAIAGFTFTDEKAARLFMEVKNGAVDASEIKQEQQQARTLTRAEVLKEKALKTIEEGEEELNRDRVANTNRRARFAASAEASATAKILFGKTLLMIAERLESGTIKYLDKINAFTELEELENVLSRCKWEFISKNKIRENDFVMCPEVVELARYPFPALYKQQSLLNLIQKLGLESGKKLASARMLKRLNRVNDGEELIIDGAHALEDYETLLTRSSRSADKWELDRYKNQLAKYKRVQRLGITAIFELRAALRELVAIKTGATISPEQKKLQDLRELERKFINAKIDGFFPTPEELAAEVVARAQIDPNCTILEPSAGLGHLAEAIAQAHPQNALKVIEQNWNLYDALTLKGFEGERGNFLEHWEHYDRIIMNPPFENLQDIDHVRHAFDLLNAGGRVVAIMSANKEGDRDKVKEFREFVEEFGSMYKNEPDAFKSAFRPTGVNTVTVVLDKP